MLIALEPAGFQGGARPADGGPGFYVGDELYRTNPRLLLTDGDWSMVRLWRLWRGGGMGVGLLPEPGGVFDQAAVMLDAFEYMDGVEAGWRRERTPRMGS